MLSIKNLTIKTISNQVLLNNITFTIEDCEIKCLTGASGSGKSTLLKALLCLMDKNLKIDSGDVIFNHTNILSMPEKERRGFLGTQIGFIPQNPMSTFFKHKKVGTQMVDTLMIKHETSRDSAKKRIALEIEKLNIGEKNKVLNAYPSELSGGMLQRLVIANIFLLKPQLILADEPISALDAKNKELILDSLYTLKEDASILFVSHDVSSIKKIGESIIFMMHGAVALDEKMQNLKKCKCLNYKWIEAFINEMESENGENWNWKNLF